MSSELMNFQEIHEFGLQVLVEYLEKKGFVIEFVQPNKNEIPHIVAKQQDDLIFIIASTDIYPNKGEISEDEKINLLDHAQNFKAKSACAYLGIANAEGVTTKNIELCGKAVKNAQFYTDFSGLEFIHFED